MAAESPEEVRRRPVIVALTSHWLALLGLGLVLTAMISWLFVLPMQIRGRADNPYIGIVAFMIIPIVFFAGLALVPVGVFLGKRRIQKRLETEAIDRRLAVRQFITFLCVTGLVNVVIGTQLTYRAVDYMETVQFCGQTCHVMKPEFMSQKVSDHARVACVDCHVGEGATGWVESKVAGTRQLFEVALNDAPRPIPPALEANRLVPAKETCETCHWVEKFGAVRLRVIRKFGDDEANTPTDTVLMMLIGGSIMPGIHGAHIGPGVEIRFAATDKARQTIPWVEYRNTTTGESHTYLAPGTAADSIKDWTTRASAIVSSSPTYQMQCVDCHNRPAHTFDLPDRALDKALMGGLVPTGLPFIKKKGLELLKAPYSTSEEAARRIPAGLDDYYRQTYPEIYAKRSADVAGAGTALLRIYDDNVFPDLKVGWGTYPNNIGHVDSPGCFRCHDGSHDSADGRATITQDCTACHVPLAIEDAAPEVLKTLGLSDALDALKKP